MRIRFTALAAACVTGCTGGAVVPDSGVDPAPLRAACSYGRGALSTVTLSDHANTLGDKIPIDHVIFVMQENRSFDHYFSSLTVPGQTVDGASPGATNPNPEDGGLVSRFHQTAYCFDNPAEEWDDIHLDYNQGKLDGFTTRNALNDPVRDPTGRRAMGYYDGSDLPFYYGLARAFATSDRHFSSAMTNTFTNRLFFMAGASFGLTSNGLPKSSTPNLFTRLNDARVSWNVYSQDFPTPALLPETWGSNLSHFYYQEQFFTDAAAGKLASVTFVEGTDMRGGVSPNEDPPADPQVGQELVSRIVQAVMASPAWPRTVLFLTYDEPGGFYDHVIPPAACEPDALPIQLEHDGGFQARFDQYGLRVPLMAISPYARRGFVSHQVTDHTSLLRFVEARFGLPALTHRDANAVPPYELFDFTQADLSVPTLPEAVIDDAGVSACAAAFPPK